MEIRETTEEIVSQLGAIADKLEGSKADHRSLRIAAFGLLFIERRGLFDLLKQFIKDSDGPLTQEQAAKLKGMGIYSQDE